MANLPSHLYGFIKVRRPTSRHGSISRRKARDGKIQVPVLTWLQCQHQIPSDHRLLGRNQSGSFHYFLIAGVILISHSPTTNQDEYRCKCSHGCRECQEKPCTGTYLPQSSTREQIIRQEWASQLPDTEKRAVMDHPNRCLSCAKRADLVWSGSLR